MAVGFIGMPPVLGRQFNAREAGCEVLTKRPKARGLSMSFNSATECRASLSWKVDSQTIAGLAAAFSVLFGAVHDANATGLVKGRLAECRADQNCISTTSIRNATKFGPPWTYLPQTGSKTEAWAALRDAVLKQPYASLVEDTGSYMRAEFPGFPKGIDDVEFLLLPEDGVVGYRSCSREVIYVYPLTQPISDFGKNRARLDQIRSELGWEQLGGDDSF
eukprot:Plantae.Rhodophyta-Rhodochaete_pulchella.ctg1983.p1 GENE.Plantae.Rhodophyta-Rhodochaete_pulchella.ctg1983~~Plantae.Rhodophyta-Rhodochaete_pulchella.ctg1983.p1  ORF type:complete len:219 (+),score=24.30 Plantae.Rhodophyta-Rhodochaete_pulchella.ctg1983:284-940(+)